MDDLNILCFQNPVNVARVSEAIAAPNFVRALLRGIHTTLASELVPITDQGQGASSFRENRVGTDKNAKSFALGVLLFFVL
jgi:hypothetical protein